MGKHTLQVEYDYDFGLIGIASHAKDYRICWALNNKFDFEFAKSNDLEIKGKKQKTPSFFSLFRFENKEDFIEYTILANKSEGKSSSKKKDTLFGENEEDEEGMESEYLIPEYKQMNYFLIIKGEVDSSEVGSLLNRIKEIDLVQTAVNLEVSKLKSKQNLIF